MKKLLLFLLASVFLIATPNEIDAQMNVQWVQCRVPGISYEVRCLVQEQAPQPQTTVVVTQSCNCQAAAVVNQTSQYQRPVAEYVDEVYEEPVPAEPAEPAWQRQQRKYKRRDIDGGFNGYRPWVRISQSTETETVVIE